MTERPVEELIGWSYNGCDMSRWDGWWWTGQRYVERAEVDDLADWLAGNGCIDSVRLEFDPHDRSYVGVTWRPNGQQISGWGQTRRDALVAAVRKVADNAQERTP